MFESIDQQALTVADIVAALAVLLVSYVLARIAKRWVARLLDANEEVSPQLTDPISRLTSWSVMLLGVVIALSMLGVGMGPAVLLFGILVVLAAVAGKGVLENFTAGLSIHFTRPFVVGDRIETQGIVGWVEAINSHAVVLRTPDGRRVLVPNRDVQGSVVINFTATSRRRSELAFSVALDENLDDVRERALAAAQGVDGVLDHPAPEVVIEALGDGIDLRLRYFHADEERRAIRDGVAEAVLDAFADAGISFSTAQLEVVLTDGAQLRTEERRAASGEGARSRNSHRVSTG